MAPSLAEDYHLVLYLGTKASQGLSALGQDESARVSAASQGAEVEDQEVERASPVLPQKTQTM